MNERVDVKQDVPSLIIEAPPQDPQRVTWFHCFVLVVHMSQGLRGIHELIIIHAYI